MKKETIYDGLRRRLAAVKGQHNAIAKLTGVPQTSISRIHSGQGDLRLSTAQPLIDYFEKIERGEVPKPARKGKSARRAPVARKPRSVPSAAAPLGQ